MSYGYVIMAQNTEQTDYQHCAQVLRDSMLRVMPDAQITIITEHMLPWGDVDPDSRWKLSNDWQVYWASPYQYTIKLEADMYITRSIEHWWSALQHRDLNLCTTIRDYRGNIATSRHYRQLFDHNQLPDVYNAVTYFKKSALAQQFYELVRDIFQHWSEYRSLLKFCWDEHPTTDVVYAIAARIIGVEHCTLPHLQHISFAHMKQHINGAYSDTWHQEYIYEFTEHSFRIANYTQQYPVHYHNKDFSKIISTELAL